jgi:hypothetical protein
MHAERSGPEVFLAIVWLHICVHRSPAAAFARAARYSTW